MLYLGGGHASLSTSCQCACGVTVEFPVLPSREGILEAFPPSAWDCLQRASIPIKLKAKDLGDLL